MSKISISILYGSQTGTALDVAETVYRQACRRHLKTALFTLDNYPIVCICLYRINLIQ